MPRTRGVDLSSEKVFEILDNTVAVKSCAPNELFKIGIINKSGKPSDGAAMKKAMPTLTQFLDASGGRAPKEKYGQINSPHG